jgi:hypothetical protein
MGCGVGVGGATEEGNEVEVDVSGGTDVLACGEEKEEKGTGRGKVAGIDHAESVGDGVGSCNVGCCRRCRRDGPDIGTSADGSGGRGSGSDAGLHRGELAALARLSSDFPETTRP